MKHRKTLAQLLALCVIIAQLLGTVPAAAYAEEPAPAAQQEEVEAPAEETGEETGEEDTDTPDEETEGADKTAEEETPAGEPEDAGEELPPELEAEEEVAGEEMPTLLAAGTIEKDFNQFDFNTMFLDNCVTEAGKGNVIGRTHDDTNTNFQTSLVIAVDPNKTYTFLVKNRGQLSIALLSKSMVQAAESGWIRRTTELKTINGGTAGTIEGTGRGIVQVSGASYLVLNIDKSKDNYLVKEDIYSGNSTVGNGGYCVQFEGGTQFQPLSDETLNSDLGFVMLYSGYSRTASDVDTMRIGDATTSAKIPLRSGQSYRISVGPIDSIGNRLKLTVFAKMNDGSVKSHEATVNSQIDLEDVLHIYLEMRVRVAEGSDSYEKYSAKHTVPREILDAVSIQENRVPTASLIKMANLNLDGTINLNLYALFDGVTSLEAHPYMLFEVPGSDGSTHEVKVNVNSTDTMESNGKTYYRFTLPLAAKQMADTVKASLWDDTGWVSKKVTYSVRTYCDNMIRKENSTPNSTTPGLVPMLHALLDYGAAAQKQFGYRTDALANSGLDHTAASEHDLSAFATQVSGEGVSLSVNLNLEEEVTLNVLIDKAAARGGTDGLMLQVNGNTVDFTEYNNDYYCAKITGITAPRLRNMYSFYVTRDGKKISKEYRSGPFSYAKQVLEDNSGVYSDNLKQLMKSMVAYHYLAWDYLKGKYPDSYRD